MSETYWRDIPGYEGYYQASTSGEIRSVVRVVDDGKRNHTGRTLKPTINAYGYFVVNLSKSGKAKVKTVHQLIAQTFLIRGDGETDVNHKNGIKTDNDVSNIHWCTRMENNRHAHENGMGHGKRLNPVEIADIEKRLAGGEINRIGLAIEYGVSVTTIINVIKRPERFKPIPDPPASRHVVLSANIPDIR